MSTASVHAGDSGPAEIIVVTKEKKKKAKKTGRKSNGEELSPWHVTAINPDPKPKERRVALTTEL